MNEPHSARSDVPESAEDARDVAWLIITLSAFAAAAAIFFAIRYRLYLDEPAWISSSLLTFAALLLVNAALYPLLRRLELLRVVFIAVITGLLTFVVLNGLEEGAGILWLYVFPPMVFYVSNLRLGAILCAFALAIITLVLTPLGPMLFNVHPYPPAFSLVLVLSLTFVMVFSFVLDRSRRQHAERLRSMAEMFEYAAKHDALTGLYNRREATHRLAGEYSRFQRNKQLFSVVLIDIDHFKRINDTFGHDTGDEVIKEVARRFEAGCRQMDMVARWGGEEFLVMLPGAVSADAVATAERIRQHMAKVPIDAGNRPLQVTCSFGVAEIRDSDTIQALLQRADEHLYKAKTSGRNRIVSKAFINDK